MEEALRTEIEQLLNGHEVVLFMKGSKSFPQCGFSATVVNILREAGVKGFKDINILQRQDLREGMKEYGNWPTFPQLYVKGQLVGGHDIIKEMFGSGDLFDVLGTEKPEVKEPKVTLTPAAVKAIQAASEGEGGSLRIEISPRFEYALSIDSAQAGDVEVKSGGMSVVFDRQSAARADGLTIDFLDEGGGGFKIHNPSEPAKVKQITVQELKALLEKNPSLELFDVRTSEERATARIQGAQHFDQAAQDKLAALSRDTPIYFHCHHGGRSQQAADHYLRQGFTDVHNVTGGIDAWSAEIDASVPRY
jgi:monothiol glutaredoxin